MSVPKSVIKFDKNGVKYISNVDYYQYSIVELTRAALRDVGKLVTRYTNAKAMGLPGMKRSKRVRGGTSAFQYWCRKKETDLIVGIKHNTWYGAHQELGDSKIKKHGFLTNTVRENIQEIVKIESQYLTGVAELNESLVSEEDYEGGADDE